MGEVGGRRDGREAWWDTVLPGLRQVTTKAREPRKLLPSLSPCRALALGCCAPVFLWPGAPLLTTWRLLMMLH